MKFINALELFIKMYLQLYLIECRSKRALKEHIFVGGLMA